MLLLSGSPGLFCGWTSRDFPGLKKYIYIYKLTKTRLWLFPLRFSSKHLTCRYTLQSCRRGAGSVAFLASGSEFYLFKVELWTRARGDLKCGVVLTPGTGAVWADEDWFCLSGLKRFPEESFGPIPCLDLCCWRGGGRQGGISAWGTWWAALVTPIILNSVASLFFGMF